MMNAHLVETEYLANHLTHENIKIIDATWHMPNLNKHAHQDYIDKHIPNALFFDIDKIADTSINLPHMLPNVDFFNAHMDAMGISNHDHIIIYDSYGFLSCARVWWTFKIMGHDSISILNGGLKKWLKETKPTQNGDVKPTPSNGYKANLNKNMVKSIAQIHQHINNNDIQIIDARAYERFTGKAPEPRAGLSSGHMPNAFNLPFNKLANEDGTLKSQQDIKKLFTSADIDLTKPIITTCGSGITAANLFFALDYIGVKNISLFDGSWTEYADNIDSIIIKDIQ